MSNPTPTHPVARAIWEAMIDGPCSDLYDDVILSTHDEIIATAERLGISKSSVAARMKHEVAEWDRIAREAEDKSRVLTMHNVDLHNEIIDPGFFDPPRRIFEDDPGVDPTETAHQREDDEAEAKSIVTDAKAWAEENSMPKTTGADGKECYVVPMPKENLDLISGDDDE